MSLTAVEAQGPNQAEESFSCRWALEWDVQSDLVAYEVPRGCSPLANGRPDKGQPRPNSAYELRRISTGALVDAVDCEIRFALGPDGKSIES